MSGINESLPGNREKIFQAVYRAIDQVNETLPKEKHIEKAPQTVLFGSEKGIDSLGLTMLIVAIEQKIEEDFDAVITLVDASTMSEEHSPFLSVEKLATHITSLVEEKLNG